MVVWRGGGEGVAGDGFGAGAVGALAPPLPPSYGCQIHGALLSLLLEFLPWMDLEEGLKLFEG
jgi:hypothetical protein